MKSELQEQSEVVRWCRSEGLKACATAQSTYTDSWSAINRNRAAGVVRGFPDLVIAIPPSRRINGKGLCAFIEMKKENGGHIKPEQREWIEALSACEGVEAAICRGAEEAIRWLSSFLQKELPINQALLDKLNSI
jgi:hypothetical protein